MELMKDFFILKKQREDQIFITNKTCHDESFCHVVLNRRFFLSQPKMLPV